MLLEAWIRGRRSEVVFSNIASRQTLIEQGGTNARARQEVNGLDTAVDNACKEYKTLKGI